MRPYLIGRSGWQFSLPGGRPILLKEDEGDRENLSIRKPIRGGSWSLCTSASMDYQLSHATIFFLMTLPSTSNIMPQTSEFVNREISKNYFSCASQPFIRNGKGKKKENKRPECQKSGGAGGTAATQSSRRTTAVVPARFVSHLRVANRLQRLYPPGDR